MAKDLYALHKDANGGIVDAIASDYSFKITDWLKSLDVRAGDTIVFGEKAERPIEAAPKLEAVS
jgi:hypothetical protein